MKRTKKPRDKVLQNIKAQRKQQSEKFKLLYNKPKVIKRTAEPEMNQCAFLPKSIVTNPKIKKSALAVYPVLCTEVLAQGAKEWVQISEENIARYSGLGKDLKLVREGVENLMETEMCDRKMVDEGTRHFYMYRPIFIRYYKEEVNGEHCNEYFSFFRCMITSGVWSKLDVRAKCFYLAARAEAKINNTFLEAYLKIEFDEYTYSKELVEEFIKSGDFRNRRWDVCEKSIAELCRIVRIEQTNFKPILDQLSHFGLLDRYDPILQVFLKPSKMVRY